MSDISYQFELINEINEPFVNTGAFQSQVNNDPMRVIVDTYNCDYREVEVCLAQQQFFSDLNKRSPQHDEFQIRSDSESSDSEDYTSASGSNDSDSKTDPIKNCIGENLFNKDTFLTLTELSTFIQDVLIGSEIDCTKLRRLNQQQKQIVEYLLSLRVTSKHVEEIMNGNYDSYKLTDDCFINISPKIVKGRNAKLAGGLPKAKKDVVRLDQLYKMVVSPILKLIRKAYRRLKKIKPQISKNELSRDIFIYFFKREPQDLFSDDRPLVSNKKKLIKNCEAEALFYVKRGVTKDWFVRAKDSDNENVQFYEECIFWLESEELRLAYQKRIEKMLAGLLGLESHASLVHLSPEAALDEVIVRISKIDSQKKNQKNPKFPVAICQYKQAIQKTKEKFEKHTLEADKKRAERKAKRVVREQKKKLLLDQQQKNQI